MKLKGISALEKNRIFSEKTNQNIKNPEIPKVISEIVVSSKNILDLGCGEGGLISAILKKYPKKNIVGVDISPRRINLLKNTFIKKRFLCEDISHTSLKGNKFNLIICTQAIEHVEDDKKLVNEFNRLLKKEGFLYVSSVIKKPWAVYKYRNNGKFVLDPTHEREYSSEEEFNKIFRFKFEPIKFKKYPVKRNLLFWEIRIPGYYTMDALWKKKEPNKNSGEFS